MTTQPAEHAARIAARVAPLAVDMTRIIPRRPPRRQRRALAQLMRQVRRDPAHPWRDLTYRETLDILAANADRRAQELREKLAEDAHALAVTLSGILASTLLTARSAHLALKQRQERRPRAPRAPATVSIAS